MVEINNGSVFRLNKDVIKRFEHNLNNGTMVLCNMKTMEFWFGNEYSKILIKLIADKKSLQDIYSEILSEYEENDYEEVVNAYNTILEDLMNKGFIEII